MNNVSGHPSGETINGTGLRILAHLDRCRRTGASVPTLRQLGALCGVSWRAVNYQLDRLRLEKLSP